MKMFRFVCLAIFTVASLTLVPAFAAPVTYTNGGIYNAPNINTDDYDSVNFVITDTSLHSYPRNISGAGTVNFTGKDNRYYLNLTGDNSAFSGTFNVMTASGAANGVMWFSSANAGFSQGTLNLADSKAIIRTKLSSSGTIQIGALEGIGLLRNDQTAGTITYQLGGANKDATFNGQIMDKYSGNTINAITAISKVGSGTQTFAGANTYSGTTTISEGTLRLIGNGTLGSATSDVTVTSSADEQWATLEFAYESGTIDFSRNIKSSWYTKAQSGGEQTGRLIKSGAATLNLTGNISSTGVETTAGIINFGSETTPNGNALRPGYLNIANSTVNYYGGTNGTMTILAGGYSFVGKTGNGTLNINSGSVKTETNDDNKKYLKMYIAGDGNATTGDNSTVGTVNIASGATYAAGSQEINVGNWGKGSINIYGTMTSSALLRLAEHTGSQGTITIYDGGSLTSNTNLFVGSYGDGLVDVKSGGKVTANGSVTVGSNGDGTILVENGGRFTSSVNIKLAAIAGKSGTITVQKGGYLKSQDIQVGSYGHGVVDNYGSIEVTSTVKLGRDGDAGSGTFNVYKDATLSANEIFPGVTMPGTLNVDGGTVTANAVAMHGRGTNATGAVTITNGGSLTTGFVQFGNVNYKTYAVDTTLTLDDGTLSVVNVTYPREGGSHTNNVNATVNLGKGTVITGAAPGVESIWWKAVHINLTSAEGTNFQVDEGKQALINSTMSGSGKLIKTGEGTLLINAAEGAVDIYSLVVSSGRLDMKEYFTGSLEVGEADADNSTVIFSPGNSVGSLEVTGNFILNSGATLLMEFDNTGTDSLLVSGTTTFEEGSILSLAMGVGTSVSPNQQLSFQLPIDIDAFDNAILDYPSFLTNLEYNSTTGILSATVDANAVPEPSTWALLVLGVIVLYLKKRVRS